MKNILITGGAGFIGSHTCLLFLEEGFNLYIVDSLANSTKEVFNGIKKVLQLSNKINNKINFFEGDIRDTAFLRSVFNEALKKKEVIDAVIHFAGLKSVGESNHNPLTYWDVNVKGSINLLKVMEENKCRTLLFSSSATIYGDANEIPFNESSHIKPFNTYGYTKASVEYFLKNIFDSDCKQWRIACLRYFNPVGAHPSGLIGENPKGKPENIFPYICQVAAGLREKLYVFGNDWPTPDGTCHRDYIHVVDLAEIHKIMMYYIFERKNINISLNVGTGKSNSVLELINTFEKVNKIKINYEFAERRPGDIATSYADTTSMLKKINWKPSRSIDDMCRDGWRWQKNILNLM